MYEIDYLEAMIKGKKIRGKTWKDDAYIEIVDGYIVDSLGLRVNWNKYVEGNHEWEIYEEKYTFIEACSKYKYCKVFVDSKEIFVKEHCSNCNDVDCDNYYHNSCNYINRKMFAKHHLSLNEKKFTVQEIKE